MSIQTPEAPPAPHSPHPARPARVLPAVTAGVRPHHGPREIAWGLVLAAALGVVIAVHAIGMYDSPGRLDDEGTYVAQAWAVQERGELAHYTYWYDHPPLGWIQIAAWTSLTDAFDRAPSAVGAGREFVLIAKIAAVCLLYVLARRMGLRRAWALVAVGLFALNPLAIEFQRAVYLDNIAIPWLLAAFVLARSPRRTLAAAAGSGLCFAAAVLTKETLLVLLPALAWQLWQHAEPTTRRFAVTVWAAVLVLTGAFYPLSAIMKNELIPGPGHVSLLESAIWQVAGRASNGSVLQAASDARETLDKWLAADPWLLAASAAAVPLAFFVPRLRSTAIALAISLGMLLRDGYLPIPYVIAILPFAALVLAGLGDALWGRARGTGRVRLQRWSGRGAVLASAALAAVLVLPGWASGVSSHMAGDPDAPMREAHTWLSTHADRSGRLVVDDSLWVDLVGDGFDPELGVIWFFKLDLDPAVSGSVTQDSIDYLVLRPSAPGLELLPRVRALMEDGEIVASFGEEWDPVNVWAFD